MECNCPDCGRPLGILAIYWLGETGNSVTMLARHGFLLFPGRTMSAGYGGFAFRGVVDDGEKRELDLFGGEFEAAAGQ